MNRNLLRGAIAEAGLTQKTVSEVTGISLSSLNSKINGHRAFDLDEARVLCEALHIDSLEKRAEIFLS